MHRLEMLLQLLDLPVLLFNQMFDVLVPLGLCLCSVYDFFEEVSFLCKLLLLLLLMPIQHGLVIIGHPLGQSIFDGQLVDLLLVSCYSCVLFLDFLPERLQQHLCPWVLSEVLRGAL